MKTFIKEKIKQYLKENSNLNQFITLKPELAKAAQKVYDDWEQNEEGYCDWLGYGGICQDIAEEMCDVLNKYHIECTTVSQEQGEQHVYVVAKTQDGVYSVDISPYLYEKGGGYCWKKIPNVEFDQRYINISKLDSDPEEYYKYIDNG